MKKLFAVLLIMAILAAFIVPEIIKSSPAQPTQPPASSIPSTPEPELVIEYGINLIQDGPVGSRNNFGPSRWEAWQNRDPEENLFFLPEYFDYEPRPAKNIEEWTADDFLYTIMPVLAFPEEDARPSNPMITAWVFMEVYHVAVPSTDPGVDNQTIEDFKDTIPKEIRELEYTDDQIHALHDLLIRDPDLWFDLFDQFCDMVLGPKSSYTVGKIGQYTSAAQMKYNGLREGVPSVEVVKVNHASGHSIIFRTPWFTIEVRMECGYQPIILIYWNPNPTGPASPVFEQPIAQTPVFEKPGGGGGDHHHHDHDDDDDDDDDDDKEKLKPKNPNAGPNAQIPDGEADADFGGGPNHEIDKELKEEPESPTSYTTPDTPVASQDRSDYYGEPDTDSGHTETVTAGNTGETITGEVVNDSDGTGISTVTDDDPAVAGDPPASGDTAAPR